MIRNPPTPEYLRWLKAVIKEAPRPEVGPLPPLAALTGTDAKALAAIDCCWELYSYTNSLRVLEAVQLLLSTMQKSTRLLARVLIARSMDWGDIERIWPDTDVAAPVLFSR